MSKLRISRIVLLHKEEEEESLKRGKDDSINNGGCALRYAMSIDLLINSSKMEMATIESTGVLRVKVCD